MKRVGLVVVLAFLALGLSARGEEKADATADDLKALDAKLTEAFKTHDVKTLDKYTADDYTEIDPLGRVHDKKQFLEYLGKSKAKFDELKETDVQVRVFGNTAVLTGMAHIKGMVKDKDISGDYRWTRVYHHKKGAEWLCILEQHTYVLPKDADKK
jgi:ketosteroid isomerase-like protein